MILSIAMKIFPTCLMIFCKDNGFQKNESNTDIKLIFDSNIDTFICCYPTQNMHTRIEILSNFKFWHNDDSAYETFILNWWKVNIFNFLGYSCENILRLWMLGKVEKVNVKWSFKTRFWKNEMERNSDEQKQIYGNYIQHHFWITVCYTWMNLNGGIYFKRCTCGLL